MRVLFSCIVAFLLIASPAAAIGVESEPAFFAEGDVLNVTVYGRGDLTGRFTVQPGVILSLPLIGAVDLAGRSPRDLEAELASAWQNRLGTPLSVNVEVIERAPFYILGDVKAPGAYPYRHGMTVLHAVAVAGGIETFGGSEPQLRMDVLRERERRSDALEERAAALAVRARLIAEQSGSETIQTPKELMGSVDNKRAEALLAEQTEIMAVRAQQRERRRQLLTEQAELGAEEVRAYQEQVEALSEQKKVVQAELKRAQKLRDTGLGIQSRVAEMNERLSSLTADTVGIPAAIARGKASIATSRSELSKLDDDLQSEIAEQLAETEQVIRRTELRERSVRQLLRSIGAPLSDDGERTEFRLLRVKDGQNTSENVSAGTPIRPGDVIEVVLRDGNVAGDLAEAAGTDLRN